MFEWEQLLPLAERMAEESDDEAVVRTGINRAYYAAYHTASSFVTASGMLRGPHSHTKVWAALVNHDDPDIAGIGERGDRLRQVRIFADYRNPFPGDLGQRAIEAVADARAIVEALRRLAA